MKKIDFSKEIKAMLEVDKYRDLNVYPEKIYCSAPINPEDDGIHIPMGIYVTEDKSVDNVEYIRADLIPKWHKYPDEKPKVIKGDFIVTIKMNETIWVSSTSYNSMEERFNSLVDGKIIAWMEGPEPYKED